MDRPSTRPARVLVMDDEPAVARSVAALLRAAGYEVVTASSPEMAFTLARAFRPDVLVVDLGTPAIFGDALAGRLRDVLPSLRTVMVTGRPDWRTHAGEFDAAIPKPIEPTALLRAVTQLVRA